MQSKSFFKILILLILIFSVHLGMFAISPQSYINNNIFPEYFNEDDINFTVESVESLFNKKIKINDIINYNEEYLSAGRTNDIFTVTIKTKNNSFKYIKRLAKYHFDNTDSQEAIYEASQSAINVYYDLKHSDRLIILEGMIPEFGTFHKIRGNAINKQPRYIVSQEYIYGLNVHDHIKTLQTYIKNPLEYDKFNNLQKEIIKQASGSLTDQQTAIDNCRKFLSDFALQSMEFFYDFWNKSGGYTILDVPESLILNIVYDLNRQKFITVDLDVLSKMEKGSFLPENPNRFSRFRDYKNEIVSLFYHFSQEDHSRLRELSDQLHEQLILHSNNQGETISLAA